MARHNWEQLRREYITGSYGSLADFARQRRISYKTLYKKASGWPREKGEKEGKKTVKIIEDTFLSEADSEVGRNTRHLQAYDDLMDIVFEILAQYKEPTKRDIYSLEKLTAVLERIQKGQALDKPETVNAPTIIIKGLMEG